MPQRKPITIRKERFYPHLPEDVWVAITDPHALAEWFEPNDHEPVAGHEFQFRCDPGPCGSGTTESKVVEADPPRRLVWSWVSVPRNPKHPRPRTHDDCLDAHPQGRRHAAGPGAQRRGAHRLAASQHDARGLGGT